MEVGQRVLCKLGAHGEEYCGGDDGAEISQKRAGAYCDASKQPRCEIRKRKRIVTGWRHWVPDDGGEHLSADEE